MAKYLNDVAFLLSTAYFAKMQSMKKPRLAFRSRNIIPEYDQKLVWTINRKAKRRTVASPVNEIPFAVIPKTPIYNVRRSNTKI